MEVKKIEKEMPKFSFHIILYSTLLLSLVFGCKNFENTKTLETPTEKVDKASPSENQTLKESGNDSITTAKKETEKIPPRWVEILPEETGIKLEIKYAGTDNFTKKKIYPCGRCFLRPEVAQKIVEIQQELKERYGFGLKLFDCYRPAPAQQRLWDAVPDPDYVTPPAKGSMHSKGLAVDLTIVDKNGNDLNMGTPYDYFGLEAHHDYEGFSAEIQKNRVLIKKVMELHGLSSIRTEWWHYSLTKKSYPLSDWEWECP